VAEVDNGKVPLVTNRLTRAWRSLRGSPRQSGPDFVQLKLRFKEFQYLLRANNEVLEIIAEIQSALERSSVLGVDFLRSRYIAASAKVFLMIRHLNTISGDRYVSLLAPFNEVRHQIDALLAAEAHEAVGSSVLPLEALQPGLEHLTGAKAGNLATLRKQGLPVPEGLVITTGAFRRVMAETGLGARLRQVAMLTEGNDVAALEERARRFQAEFAAIKLPADLELELVERCRALSTAQGGAALSLRSSALAEDTHTSFAGLYTSRLGVPPDDAPAAYLAVLASLYSPQALAYRQRHGLSDLDAEMAVLVQVMVEPAVSGVLYTTDPLGGGNGPAVISAVPGLGLALVNGSLDADVYTVERSPHAGHTVRHVGRRDYMLVAGPQGLQRRKLDAEQARQQVLPAEAIQQLAALGSRIENILGQASDVEWAQDSHGRLWILQARPLRLVQGPASPTRVRVSAPVILSGGQTGRPGTAFGPVHVVHGINDMAGFPNGAVLVARESSPALAALLPAAAALITEVGGVAGHLAALAREYGLPALLGVPGALGILTPGLEITLDAGNRKVYAGRVGALLNQKVTTQAAASRVQALPLGLRAVQLITRLNLTDPKAPEFRPENCRSFHDLIRFMHEMSFKEMFRLGDEVGRRAGGEARRLDVRLPFDLWIIDLGGGLNAAAGERPGLDAVESRPAAAFLKGLTDQRVDWKSPRPMTFKGLASVFSGSLLNPPQDAGQRGMGGRAYGILGTDYLNFNCRVGYHFTALDCYCGQRVNDNYVSFRFHGGAATEDRRSLRAVLVERILDSLGFNAERTGDAVNAFLKKRGPDEIERILEELGRLVLFTRQLDMLMEGPHMVEWLAQAFSRGDYNLTTSPNLESGS
jgi:pyruvate,water dikinase